jgi:hypothetical protein
MSEDHHSCSSSDEHINETLSSGPTTPTKRAPLPATVAACYACQKSHRRCDTRSVCMQCSARGLACVRDGKRKDRLSPPTMMRVSPTVIRIALKHRGRRRLTVHDDEAELIREAAHALVLLAKRYCAAPGEALTA